MNNIRLTDATILLLPSLGDSGPDHLQTHWEAAFGFERVDQQDWDTPAVEDWIERLHKRIVADNRSKILVGHSLACVLAAHWSRFHHGPVVAALLVAPSDVEDPSYPISPIDFAPMPLQRLGMHSLVGASNDDIYVPLVRGRQFADAWGSEYILLGPRGQIGRDTKLGLWPRGLGSTRAADCPGGHFPISHLRANREYPN